MKALTVRQPFAGLIASGLKTIEIRSRPVSYRGPLLITASASPKYGYAVTGSTLCVVDLLDCSPATEADEDASWAEHPPGAFAWILGPPRPIKQTPCKGRLNLWAAPEPEYL